MLMLPEPEQEEPCGRARHISNDAYERAYVGCGREIWGFVDLHKTVPTKMVAKVACEKDSRFD